MLKKLGFIFIFLNTFNFDVLAGLPVRPLPASRQMPSQNTAAQTQRAATNAAASTRLSNNAKELTEALNITGQSRNLSMGLLMGKRGSLSFGKIRLDYRDKIILKSTNF